MGKTKPKIRKTKRKIGKTKSQRWKISGGPDRIIALLSSVMAVVGWALLIMVNARSCVPTNKPPAIQNFQSSQDTVPAGETIEARVIVKDSNLPDDEIHYFWAAYRGRIGKQLNRFQGDQIIYVAPDTPGLDIITVTVSDSEGEIDKDFKVITVTERRKKLIIVGNKNFTEQRIAGQLMKQLLENRGFAVKLVSDLYSPELRRKMEKGEIDICAEYTGTAWMVHLKRKYTPGMDNNKVYSMVKAEETANGFIWLKPMWNNNTYALASWPEFAKEHNLETLSDLAALYRKKKGKIKTFVNTTFARRPDGLSGVKKHYGFKIDESDILVGEPGTSGLSLKQRKCDVAMIFGTDPQVAKYGWHVYKDDKLFFPPYDLTPYVRKGVLDKYPEIANILSELVLTFPGGGREATPEIVAEGRKVWQKLNAEVDIEKMKPAEVAREYLIKHDLLKN